MRKEKGESKQEKRRKEGENEEGKRSERGKKRYIG
jgi:hypothetical protein